MTTKEINKLSKTKKEWLKICFYAIKCIDDSKVSKLKLTDAIEEECAVFNRGTIEIRNGSIDFGVKINDKNGIKNRI